jgi:2,4-dienoyl-CoA reductase-like NADH-dependent reductase (Old Yellow Enzyme family)
MSLHERFAFKSLEEIQAKITSLGLDIPMDGNTAPLHRKVYVGSRQAPNSLAIHPLECRDSLADGSPSELTFRRYKRFAEGGAGQIWYEATSFTPRGRSDEGQLALTNGTLPEFTRLCAETRQAASKVYGTGHTTIHLLEVTHSGRYSGAGPVIAVHNPVLDAKSNLTEDFPLITDDELERLEDQYVDAARLVMQAGFDGIDIKACHGYLAAELLGARTRPGAYGGSFENRVRFIVNTVDKIRAALGENFLITTRLSAFDAISGGWGMDLSGSGQPDPQEPIRLLKLLYEKGIRLVNLSAGNPYINPSVGRPFDRSMKGGQVPAEHPLEGVARLIGQTRQIQQAVPGMAIVGTGYSWLRQYLGYSAAANIRRGWVSVVGLGREALAYPNFARDLLDTGSLDPRKTCITCSLCSQLMREGGPTGCVIYDREVYRPIFQQKCMEKPVN